MITRCVYCGQYYSFNFGAEEDPGYCGKEECKKKKEAEKSFYSTDVRIPAPFPGEKGSTKPVADKPKGKGSKRGKK